MGASDKDLNELIDAWVEEQLALSPEWCAEKREAIFALLGFLPAEHTAR